MILEANAHWALEGNSEMQLMGTLWLCIFCEARHIVISHSLYSTAFSTTYQSMFQTTGGSKLCSLHVSKFIPYVRRGVLLVLSLGGCCFLENSHSKPAVFNLFNLSCVSWLFSPQRVSCIQSFDCKSSPPNVYLLHNCAVHLEAHFLLKLSLFVVSLCV